MSRTHRSHGRRDGALTLPDGSLPPRTMKRERGDIRRASMKRWRAQVRAAIAQNREIPRPPRTGGRLTW